MNNWQENGEFVDLKNVESKGNLAIREACKQVYANAVAKGFWSDAGDELNIPTKLMLIVSECAEAMEADRKTLGNLGEELADIVIRVFDLAEGLGIDLETEIVTKMAINANRPYKHGNKKY